jgi:hypothetical protein
MCSLAVYVVGGRLLRWVNVVVVVEWRYVDEWWWVFAGGGADDGRRASD